jgi:hypothetical protein
VPQPSYDGPRIRLYARTDGFSAKGRSNLSFASRHDSANHLQVLLRSMPSHPPHRRAGNRRLQRYLAKLFQGIRSTYCEPKRRREPPRKALSGQVKWTRLPTSDLAAKLTRRSLEAAKAQKAETVRW